MLRKLLEGDTPAEKSVNQKNQKHVGPGKQELQQRKKQGEFPRGRGRGGPRWQLSSRPGEQAGHSDPEVEGFKRNVSKREKKNEKENATDQLPHMFEPYEQNFTALVEHVEIERRWSNPRKGIINSRGNKIFVVDCLID